MNIHISDLMDLIDDNSLFLKAKTPISLGKVKRRTKIVIAKTKQLSKPLFLRFAIPAILVSVLSVTGLAVGIYAGVGEWFQSLFVDRTRNALTEEQVSFVTEHAMELHSSDTVNGYGICLDGILHDGLTTYMRISVSAPEKNDAVHYSYGFKNLPVLRFGAQTIDCTLMEWSGGFEEQNQKTQYLLVAYWESESDLQKMLDQSKTVILEMTDMYRYDTSVRPAEIVLIADGTWHLEIPAESFQATRWNKELINVPIDCEVTKAMSGEAITIKITSINLHAMSAVMVYEYPNDTLLESITPPHLSIVLHDGTVIDAYPSGGQIIQQEKGYIGEMTFGMTSPIILADCSHIILPNGEKIRIN